MPFLLIFFVYILFLPIANAIVHLMFKRPEDKLAAQMSEESITRSLENAIGCPVTVNMSIEPADLEINPENAVPTTINQPLECSHSRQQPQTAFLPESIYSAHTEAVTRFNTHWRSAPPSKNLRPTKLKDCTLVSQGRDRCPTGEKEATTAQPQQILPSPQLLKQENQLDASEDPKPNFLTREWVPINTAHFMSTNRPKHRWLSLSSIQQSDASVEPYSRDILYESAQTEKEIRARRNPKHQKGFSKTNEDQHSLDSATSKELYRSWSCTNLLCQRKTKVRNHAP
ncbi:hypothetical protein L1049_026527 [Liquidambar formosana]|uniref:STICHEL DnaA-N-like alpha-beta domain-containing protein n=1 Tax=Liquidambar formosana TaxID=63359 RepID=A0AAP0NGK6_LIQFO